MKRKCFIFDLDGVIVDTAKYHYQAHPAALRPRLDGAPHRARVLQPALDAGVRVARHAARPAHDRHPQRAGLWAAVT